MSPDNKPIRIVVADDDAALLAALCGLLEDAGYDVVATASDGDEAIAAVADTNPDLVMVDLRMPRMSGLAVAERLRADRSGLPVIVLSAYDDASLQLAAERVPVASYLVKGCSSRHIFRAINDAVA